MTGPDDPASRLAAPVELPLDVRADGVQVAYGSRLALAGVSLQVRPGQLVAVTGPSGAGKTTLLWVLAGLVAPDSGSVLFGGQRLGDRDAHSAAGVVLVPQGNALATVLTAGENVLVPLLAARVAPAAARARTTAALEAVGLGPAATQLVEELSGGQQQRVAVARGLAQQGRVLLADEPTSELDAVNRERVVQLLREQAARGAAVVLATHDPEAAAACDGELHLEDGSPHWRRATSGEYPTPQRP